MRWVILIDPVRFSLNRPGLPGPILNCSPQPLLHVCVFFLPFWLSRAALLPSLQARALYIPRYFYQLCRLICRITISN